MGRIFRETRILPLVFVIGSAFGLMDSSHGQPLGHWELDGELADATGGHDGAWFGSPEPVFIRGYDGTPAGAVYFDGIDDYIGIDDPSGELALTTEFTLALWFRAASTDQSQKYLLSRNAPGGQYAIIYEYSDDRVDFFAPSRSFGDDPRAGAQSEMPIIDTDWHHIAYTYDGSTWSGYIDGVVQFEAVIEFGLSDAFASSWWIGAANPDVNHVRGAIDDVRIYGEWLDEDEIADLASGGVVIECPPLGDTRCEGLSVVGPAGDFAGTWTLTANAIDDTSDSIFYTFRAESAAGAVIEVGPTSSDAAEIQLLAGTWTLSVFVDDDPFCDDVSATPTCSREIEVLAPAPRLVAHWTFDETLADAAGGHDGAFFGDVEPLFVDGHDGAENGAIALDGIDDYVEVADDAELRFTSRFSFVLWFRSASVDQSQTYVIARHLGGADQYAIIYEYDEDRIDFYAPGRLFGEDPRAGGRSLMPISDTDWHHVAYTNDGNRWSGYVDGVQVFSHEISFALSDLFVGNWYIGSASPTVNFTAGDYDDVRFYDYALTAEEIRELAGEEVNCPEVGDTRVTTFEISDPPEEGPGLRTATATATDDSGDEVSYTFRARRASEDPIVIGPTTTGETDFDLGYGDWEISVTVDDDPLCPDTIEAATMTRTVAVRVDGLVGHWPLDGELSDATGSSDGVFFGDVEPLFVEGFDGEEDGAVRFDGVDDYIEILETPRLRPTDRFTLALWFRSASTDQSQKYLLSKNSGAGQYAIIYEYDDDKVDFYAPSRLFGDDPRAGGQSLLGLADTDWHHIAYTYDASTWKGYIDGVGVFSAPITFALSDRFLASWFIGAANPSVNHVAGDIDDVRIYASALTAAEVEVLANRGEDPPPRFIRGDSDASGTLNITDGIRILSFLFLGSEPPGCLDASDADDSGALNITDGIYVLSYLFTGGAEPPPPFGTCGSDPSGDADGVTCVESHTLGACAN
jgi:hypothetical protein